MHPYLQKFQANNFKNYEEISVSFSPGINCFTGLNGTGKTNLLDAIYYMSICRSYFSLKDADLIRHQQDYFRLEGNYNINNEAVKIAVAYGLHKRKQLSNNDVKINKVAEHIGYLPIMFIAPDDISLVKGYSNERRKLLDQVLCQADKDYLLILSQFQKALQQRNSHLKNCNQQPDIDLMNTYNEQLNEFGTQLHSKRKQFLAVLMDEFRSIYKAISDDFEQVSYTYNSDLNDESYPTILKNSFQKDIILKRTTAGVQRDEVAFEIKHNHAKQFGSQGQQKNFLIAFKLACAKHIHKVVGKMPILLLDDIFDKLDNKRVAALVNVLSEANFGQVFLTDTEFSRMQIILNNLAAEKKLFIIEDGIIKEP